MITRLIEYLKKNWLGALLLFAGAIYVLSGYGMAKTFHIVSVLVCMFVTIFNFVEIYIEGKYYLIHKSPSISVGRIIYLLISSLAVILLTIFVLPARSIIFAFSFAGIVLVGLLVYEIFLTLKKS